MPTYRLKNLICAVDLNRESQIATQLPATTVLRVIEPSRELKGFISVESESLRFAIFLSDLNRSGERIHTRAKAVLQHEAGAQLKVSSAKA
jgi:hypothetical protein